MKRVERGEQVLYLQRHLGASIFYAVLSVLLLAFSVRAWAGWQTDRANGMPSGTVTLGLVIALIPSALGLVSLGLAMGLQRAAAVFIIDRPAGSLHVRRRTMVGRTRRETYALERFVAVRIQWDGWQASQEAGDWREMVWIDPRGGPPILFLRRRGGFALESYEAQAEQLNRDLGLPGPILRQGY